MQYRVVDPHTGTYADARTDAGSPAPHRQIPLRLSTAHPCNAAGPRTQTQAVYRPRRAEQARILVIKGFASISAIIFGVLALTTLMRFIDTFENIITMFSTYDALATALGIVGYVVCGLLIAVFAAFACVPLIHAVLDPAALNRGSSTERFCSG